MTGLFGQTFNNTDDALRAYEEHKDALRRAYEEQKAQKQKDLEEMLAQYQENERSSVKEPKTSFWSYFFSKAGKINEKLFAQIANFPEWSKIAEKKGSETFLVVDEPTLEILKSKSLPVDSGENGSYFNFIKNSGYNFVKIEDLINKLPEKDRELCGKIYDKIDNFVKIDALPMASIRDFAKVLVSMAGNQFVKNIGGDNRNGMLIEKEPDIFVNSGDVDSSPMDFSMNTKLLLVRGALIPVDAYHLTLLIDAETTHGQKNIIQHEELSKIFCNNNNRYDITNSVEVYGRRGESLYYTPSLREANGLLDGMEKYFVIDKNIINTNSSAIMARHLVSKFEKHELLNYPNINPNAECFIKAGESGLGIIGQYISRTWNEGKAGWLGGKYIPISADISDIERIMNSTVTQEDLAFNMVKDLIKTTSVKDTPSSGLELLTTNSTQAPINEKYTAPQTPPKTETNFFTFSLKKILALLASSSSLNNMPSSLSPISHFVVAQQSLISHPSSHPALKTTLELKESLNQTSSQKVLKEPLYHQLLKPVKLKEDLRR